MIGSLLQIRFRQIQRFLAELGFIRAILIVGTALAMVVKLSSLLNSNGMAWVVTGIFIFTTASIQLSRTDKVFLKLVCPQPSHLFLTEYVLLASPLLVLLLAKGYILQLISFVPLILIVSFLNYSLSFQSKNYLNFSYLPPTAFEWKVGLRQNIIIIILIPIIGLFFYQFFISFFIIILLISLIVANFYLEMESRFMLESQLLLFGQTYFLFQKTGQSFLLFIAGTLPISIVFLFIYSHFWYLLLATYSISFLLLAFAITLKYAFYEENSHQKILLSILQMIAILFLIIPFISGFPTPILTILLTIYFFRKAQHNLRNYTIN